MEPAYVPYPTQYHHYGIEYMWDGVVQAEPYFLARDANEFTFDLGQTKNQPGKAMEKLEPGAPVWRSTDKKIYPLWKRFTRCCRFVRVDIPGFIPMYKAIGEA